MVFFVRAMKLKSDLFANPQLDR